jgi:hypothetical protein
MSSRHFTCFLGCIGAPNRALVTTSISGALFWVLHCSPSDICFMRLGRPKTLFGCHSSRRSGNLLIYSVFGRQSRTARLPRGQQIGVDYASSCRLQPSYGCGGCRILWARTVGQYVESAGLEKTTAAPSAMKGVRNDRRARSSSAARLKPDRMLERCS